MRMEANLEAALATIERGFCSGAMKSRYRDLVKERWQALG